MVSNIDLSKEECFKSNILTNDFDFFQHDFLIDISAFLYYFLLSNKGRSYENKTHCHF
jgi:hypothetical protein